MRFKSKLMLGTVILAFLLLFSFDVSSEEKIGLVEYWPGGKNGLMCVAGNRVFFGDIREIRVFDFDLNQKNSIPILGVGDISALHWSSSSPGLIYVALGNGGLGIYDINDPDNHGIQRFVGSISTEGMCQGVYVNSGTAYLATGNAGLKIIDVSNPSAPVAKGDPFLPGALAQTSVRKVVMSGRRVFVADTLNGLWSIDSTASDYKEGYGILVYPGASCLLPFQDSRANLWLGGAEKVVPVSYINEQMSQGEGLKLTKPVDMTYMGQDRILVADSQSGVRHLMVSGSSTLIESGATMEPEMVAHSVVANGSRFFAGDHRYGIRSADISGNQIPDRFTGPSAKFTPRFSALTIAENGNKVFSSVADPDNPSDNGLMAFDTSVVTQPTVVARIKLSGEPGTVKISEKTAFVASGSAGLKIVDVSSFEKFREIASRAYADKVRDLDVSGKIVYVAAGTAGLRIVDATDPSNPVDRGVLTESGVSYRYAAVSGTTLYLSDSGSGITVVDVSQPDNPVKITTFATSGTIRGMTVSGKLLHVGNSETGLEVYDISSPQSPFLKGSLAIDGGDSDWRMSGADEAVFIAAGKKGLIAVDVSKPSAPVLFEGWSYSTETVSGVWARSGDPMFVYTAADTYGMRVLGLERDTGEEPPPFVPRPFGQIDKHSECFIGSLLD